MAEVELKISYANPADLIEYVRNPRKIMPSDVDQMAALLTEFGWTAPILVRDGGKIVDGHLRRRAAIKLGTPQVPVADVSHLNDAQIKALRLAMNRSGQMVEWDEELLKLELEELKGLDFNLTLTAFDLGEIKNLFDTGSLAGTAGESGGEGGEGGGDGDRSSGDLLKLTEIAIGPPKTSVNVHDVWRIGHHALVCACPHEDWQMWVQFLKHPDDLFVPYPGIWVPLGVKAKERALVMVQPSTFIAGHIIDRWREINGDETIERLQP